MTDTLGDALPREMARVRNLIPIYASLPNKAGAFAIAMMQGSLTRAEKALAEDDVIRMVAAYAELKEYKE